MNQPTFLSHSNLDDTSTSNETDFLEYFHDALTPAQRISLTYLKDMENSSQYNIFNPHSDANHLLNLSRNEVKHWLESHTNIVHHSILYEGTTTVDQMITNEAISTMQSHPEVFTLLIHTLADQQRDSNASSSSLPPVETSPAEVSIEPTPVEPQVSTMDPIPLVEVEPITPIDETQVPEQSWVQTWIESLDIFNDIGIELDWDSWLPWVIIPIYVATKLYSFYSWYYPK